MNNETIGGILSSADQLEAIFNLQKTKTPIEFLGRLKDEGRMEDLISCLVPTIQGVIRPARNMGVADEELIAIALTATIEAIRSWETEHKTMESSADYLTFQVHSLASRKVRSEVCGRYGLGGNNFILVAGYFDALRCFERDVGRVAEYEDLEDIRQMLPPEINTTSFKKAPNDWPWKIQTSCGVKMDLLKQVHCIYVGEGSVDPVGDETANGAEEEIWPRVLAEEMRQVMRRLTIDQKEVLILRYGLDGGKERTRDEIAGQMELTNRARAGQMEAKGLRRLRHPFNSKRLEDYL